MAKQAEKTVTIPEQTEQTVSPTPVLDRIFEFILAKAPVLTHETLRAHKAKFIGEQDGFLRSMNRQDYRRDAEAYRSAGVEVTKQGRILNYSNMKSRRVDDVTRETLLDFARALYPPTLNKAGNLDHHNAQREAWTAGMGFKEEKKEGWVGKRFKLDDPLADALRKDLEGLIPEIYEGSERPDRPAKVTVQFIDGPKLGGMTVSRNLYDPEVVGPDKFNADVDWLLLNLVIAEEPYRRKFADVDKPIVKAYEPLLAKRLEEFKAAQAKTAAA